MTRLTLSFYLCWILYAFHGNCTVLSQKNKRSYCPYKTVESGLILSNPFKIHPNYEDKRTPELIRMAGYPVEAHEVLTTDGYILTVFRIPFSKNSAGSVGKVPVFCMHGGLSSSAQWISQPPQRALVFMLADAGYDVWIGNARGSRYSQKHISLLADEPMDLRYWNFSAHEYGKYDVPAVINYITDYTSQESLYWIGHSLGAGQLFLGISLNPELNTKVKTMFALAPAAYIGNSTNVFVRIYSILLSDVSAWKFLNVLGIGKLFPFKISHLISAVEGLCRFHWLNIGLCKNLVYFFSGFSCQLNITSFPAALAQVPETSSAKAESHFAQWIQTGEFREYDYGRRLNLKEYGRATPPNYNWSNFDVPVVIYYSDSDNVVVSKDITKTVTALGSNVKEVNQIKYPYFRHVDFVIGTDADELLYRKIITTMNSGKYDR